MSWFKRSPGPAVKVREPHARPLGEDALLALAFICTTCGRTDLTEAGEWDPPICQECDAAINEDADCEADASDDGW